MKKQKEFETWAYKKLQQVRKILLLEHYTPLTLEFNEKKPDVSESEFRYPYQDITIRYSQGLYEAWEKKNYEFATSVLAHEMCHALTDPLYAKATNRWVSRDEVEDEREKLTDHIANVIVASRLV